MSTTDQVAGSNCPRCGAVGAAGTTHACLPSRYASVTVPPTRMPDIRFDLRSGFAEIGAARVVIESMLICPLCLTSMELAIASARMSHVQRCAGGDDRIVIALARAFDQGAEYGPRR